MSSFIEIGNTIGDYGALIFENQNKITIKDIFKEMKTKNVNYLEKEIDGNIIYFKLKNFKDADEEFLTYIFDEFVDYDSLKHKDLVKVEN